MLGLLFTAELFLILGLMVMNTYFLTRGPVLSHLREIYFINSLRFKRAWYLVIAAMTVFLFLQAVDIFVQAGRIASASGVRELFLVVFATLVIGSFVEIVQIFERYIPRFGSDDRAIQDRIRFDLRRHLLDRSEGDLQDLLPSTADVYLGRDVLGPYVSIAHYRGVVLGLTRFLERRYGQLGDALLYSVGRQTARTVVRDLLEEVGPERAADQFLDALRTAHVGLPQIEEMGEGRRRILLRECAICCGMPVAGGAECHYLTGLFSGLHEILWDRAVEAREVRCWAMGDKVCEFEVVAQ